MYSLLETKSKGVRDHIIIIKRMMLMVPDIEEELKLSVDDGFLRYPEWPEMKKVKNWLAF